MAKSLAKLLSMLTPKRRWAQFSLATMLLVVTVLCVGLSLVVAVVVPAERQRRAVVAIKALGGTVEYVEPDQKATETFPRPFLQRWLPRDYVDELREIDLSVTEVTDVGLAQLQGLTALQELNLGYTKVTDAGLAHVQGLTELQELDLYGTHVTDAALAHLHGLRSLRRLSLNGTRVTDVGLAKFRRALPNCQIFGP